MVDLCFILNLSLVKNLLIKEFAVNMSFFLILGESHEFSVFEDLSFAFYGVRIWLPRPRLVVFVLILSFDLASSILIQARLIYNFVLIIEVIRKFKLSLTFMNLMYLLLFIEPIY